MVSTTCTNEKFKEVFESSKREYLNEMDRHSKLLFEAGGFCFLNILVWVSFIILGSTSKISQVFSISSFCFLPITSKILGTILLTSVLGLGIPFFYFIRVFFQGRPFKSDAYFRVNDKDELDFLFTTVADFRGKSRNPYAPYTFEAIFGRHFNELNERNTTLNKKIYDLLECGIIFFSIFTLLYMISSTLLIFLQ